MSHTPASTGAGFEVVVGNDGALVVSAAELVSHDVGPDARVRLVPVQQSAAGGGRMAGALAGSVSPEAVEELLQSLDDAKAKRAAHYGRTAGQS